MKNRIITIDGPAGSGKTTVSKALAQRLGCIYVDTGALYRGVAFELQRQKIDYKEDKALEKFLKSLDLTFAIDGDHDNGQFLLLSSGRDITPYIRTPEISMLASLSSARPLIRSALLNVQRNIADEQDAVFEGRDMGTVVFPDASFKFFLFADITIRAKRRFDEMPEEEKNFTQVQKEMEIRDNNDSNRAAAPLKPAEDAIHINSSDLTIGQVIEKMLEHIKKAKNI
jgi:CMP/dCMP kinase